MTSWPDVEARLVGYLAEALPVSVSTRVPNPRPSRFVRVWRTGGPVTLRVMDRPVVTVEAWGADEVGAHDLAEQARSLLLDGARRRTAGLHTVAVQSMYSDPDPDTGIPRYTITATVSVRAMRA